LEREELSPRDPFDPPPSDDEGDDVSDALPDGAFSEDSPDAPDAPDAPSEDPPDDSLVAVLLRARESVE
jgi:hypothetical protein